MLQQTIINLEYDIALLQLYVGKRQEAGFSDMTRILESLSIKLFKAVYNLDLKDKNTLITNFPTIDLADDLNRTALQVTLSANLPKVKHALKLFSKSDLNRDYDKLFIVGS